MFRKYALPSLLILVIAGAAAFAQTTGNITRGLQLSQDPTGPIGVDTSGNAYFPRKLLFPNTSAFPALSSCGTSPSLVGNDVVGKLTTGSGATTCTLTFSQAWAVAPACFVQAQGGATQPTYTTSTTAITITVDIASTVYNYFCASQG